MEEKQQNIEEKVVQDKIEEVENKNVDVKANKPKKSALQKWSNVTLTFSIIAVVYALFYIASGFLTMLPALVLWIAWLTVVVPITLFSIGLIWLNDGFKAFNQAFIDFNTKVGNGSIGFTQFLYKALPYMTAFFALWLLAFLILSIVGFARHKDKKEGFKAKLIWAIILIVLFVVLIILDLIFAKNVV